MPDRPPQQRYQGLWRRTLLQTPDLLDTRTRVYWLQVGEHFIDLRIPAERPSFAGIESLQQCDDRQRAWLAQQQGFAGRLLVAPGPGQSDSRQGNSAQGDTLEWLRELDLQPNRQLRDVGLMQFEADVLLEQGVLSDYIEHWYPQAGANGAQYAYRLAEVSDGDGHALPWRGYLLGSGGYFMLCIDHRPLLPQAESLLQLATGSGNLTPEHLDMEISLGRVDSSGQHRIELSTHPFREGCNPFAAGQLPSGTDAFQHHQNHCLLTWHTLHA